MRSGNQSWDVLLSIFRLGGISQRGGFLIFFNFLHITWEFDLQRQYFKNRSSKANMLCHIPAALQQKKFSRKKASQKWLNRAIFRIGVWVYCSILGKLGLSKLGNLVYI